MSSDARRRAEACFRVARSSTFEGERRNAIERGTAIAEAAGLDLDSFDVPGGARTRSSRPGGDFDLFDFHFEGDADELEALLRSFEAALRRGPPPTVNRPSSTSARQRGFEEAVKRERDRRIRR